ncbi:MAG: hypothetical protein CL678_16690 [Bdellovibrionaceae bacterium]|nr:hypothetical protein [Pseudobdellovibrionaceae bacterium]
MAAVVAVFCSLWRPGSIVFDAVSAAVASSAIDEVVVFGYEPTGRATAFPMPVTEYHTALYRWNDSVTADFLCKRGKFCGVDPRPRVLWRAKLALDMWACLTKARQMFPTATLVWLENDAILIPKMLPKAIAAAQHTGASACYGVGKWYSGQGTLCFVFLPQADPSPHLLSYHLVQPADWIVGDFSRGKWPLVPSVTHGRRGNHISTRKLLNTV